MALQSTIDRVRSRVRDNAKPLGAAVPPGKALFPDTEYNRAVQFALEKLSFDFGEAYTDESLVPFNRMFLLVKLATIEMCYVRAAALETGEDESSGGIVSSISVPDLSISQDTDDASGADFWLDLADKLQAEYDNEVGADKGTAGTQGTLPDVIQGVVHRHGLRNNSRAGYNTDVPLPPTTITVETNGSDLIVRWTEILEQHFAWYEIYLALSPDTLEEPEQRQRVHIISDPHGEFTESGIIRPKKTLKDNAPGTYQVRMAVVNNNSLRSWSNIVTVTVT